MLNNKLTVLFPCYNVSLEFKIIDVYIMLRLKYKEMKSQNLGQNITSDFSTFLLSFYLFTNWNHETAFACNVKKKLSSLIINCFPLDPIFMHINVLLFENREFHLRWNLCSSLPWEKGIFQRFLPHLKTVTK